MFTEPGLDGDGGGPSDGCFTAIILPAISHFHSPLNVWWASLWWGLPWCGSGALAPLLPKSGLDCSSILLSDMYFLAQPRLLFLCHLSNKTLNHLLSTFTFSHPVLKHNTSLKSEVQTFIMQQIVFLIYRNVLVSARRISVASSPLTRDCHRNGPTEPNTCCRIQPWSSMVAHGCRRSTTVDECGTPSVRLAGSRSMNSI